MKKCIYKITLIPCLFHKNRRSTTDGVQRNQWGGGDFSTVVFSGIRIIRYT